ncbi:hypothetical protein [Synechococcus sp. CBW1006]|uniref:hypothetical protein n=2 Tax=unclassified Synechococcus TaxID=2626047 RepID=UPI0018CF1A42|nr:hypothetical protein [Synechococcus sp. CBW1006]QPN67806.1 hypothetical protein H8F26_06635 [Synechococcus sp. CBW1006]
MRYRIVLGLIVALGMPAAASAGSFCLPEERYFQSLKPPVERYNNNNVQQCSSGQACLNQLRSAMARQQLWPASYEWIRKGKIWCLEERPPRSGTTAAGEAGSSASPPANPAPSR